MVNINAMIERYRNMLDILITTQRELITAQYTEHDLKSILWVLGDYKAIIEEVQNENDTI